MEKGERDKMTLFDRILDLRKKYTNQRNQIILKINETLTKVKEIENVINYFERSIECQPLHSVPRSKTKLRMR